MSSTPPRYVVVLALCYYISVAVGWGGAFGLFTRATERKTPGTVYTFALGGQAKLPPFVKYQLSNLVAGIPYKAEDVPLGTGLYVSNCAFCHGVPNETCNRR